METAVYIVMGIVTLAALVYLSGIILFLAPIGSIIFFVNGIESWGWIMVMLTVLAGVFQWVAAEDYVIIKVINR